MAVTVPTLPPTVALDRQHATLFLPGDRYYTPTQLTCAADAIAATRGLTGMIDTACLTYLTTLAATLSPYAVWAEIGTYYGCSATAVGHCLPPHATLLLIDAFVTLPTRHGPFPSADPAVVHQTLRALHHARPDLTILLLPASGAVILAGMPAASVDVVFVDGDHTTPAVVADLLAALHCIRPGGVICGHDYDQPKVARAVSQVFPTARPVPHTILFAGQVPDPSALHAAAIAASCA